MIPKYARITQACKKAENFEHVAPRHGSSIESSSKPISSHMIPRVSCLIIFQIRWI